MFIEIGPNLAGMLLPTSYGIAIGIVIYAGYYVVKALMDVMVKM
jgi:hypothetical protein